MIYKSASKLWAKFCIFFQNRGNSKTTLVESAALKQNKLLSIQLYKVRLTTVLSLKALAITIQSSNAITLCEITICIPRHNTSLNQLFLTDRSLVIQNIYKRNIQKDLTRKLIYKVSNFNQDPKQGEFPVNSNYKHLRLSSSESFLSVLIHDTAWIAAELGITL